MEYFYLWGLLFVLPFTIYAYIKSNKDEKIKMIISGIGFGIFSVVFADDVFHSYWEPKYLIDGFYIEDFLYGLLFAGIIPSMHNILGKKHMKGKFKLNNIYPLSITPLIIGIISFIRVKGNIKDVLISIGSSLLITLLVYNIILLIYPNAINTHFVLDTVNILRVPITEWLFAICLGVGCTYTYESLFGFK